MITSPENMTGVFNEDRDWLANQPNMQPWERGCEDLVKQMATWIEQHTGNFCEAAIGADSKNYANYESRVWQCWRHHWQKAAGDGQTEGREIAKKHHNLFHDVVLVEAMLQGSNEAIDYFTQQVRHHVKGWGNRVGPEFANDISWWDDMLPTLLVGIDGKKPRLAGFIGSGNLKGWLGKVVSNELKEVLKKRIGWQQADLDEHDADEITLSSPTVSSECTELLVSFLSDLLVQVDAKTRTAVFLLSEGLSITEIAVVIDLHKGNVSKRLTGLYKTVEERLQAVEERGSHLSQELRECLDDLTGGGTSVFALLRRFLGPNEELED